MNSCENYVNSPEINQLVTKNDLSITFKVLKDPEHTCEIRKISDDSNMYKQYVKIDIKNKFSLSSGEVPIKPGKAYKISLTQKNKSANPLLLYTFWRNRKTPIRNFTYVGTNGNPPSSRTQERNTSWVTFEETFQTKANEAFMMIRLNSGSGEFAIGDFSIQEIE
jgi:hypothetical protein